MDLATACSLSRFNQAGYLDRQGRLILAELSDEGSFVYWRQTNSKKDMKPWVEADEHGAWRPIAPRGGV